MIHFFPYTAITTKIRALQKELLSLSDLKDLAESPDFSSAIQKLILYPGYREVLLAYNTEDLHRRDLERILNLIKFRAFAKLYRFANFKQRAFLNFYFMKYELELLKRCLRKSIQSQTPNLDLHENQIFFEKHSKLNFKELTASDSLSAFVENLKGSIYYRDLYALLNSGKTSRFEYELHMNLLYFKMIWHEKDKFLSKKDRAILSAIFGTEIDLLNIQWIYRTKKYYTLSDSVLYSLLIPNYYKLKKNEISKLVNISDMKEFETIFSETYYGKVAQKIFHNIPDVEKLYKALMHKVYLLNARKYPYSIASISLYLSMKDMEVENIINIVESVRYSLPPEQIIRDILKIREENA